jgi:hypothetical protein
MELVLIKLFDRYPGFSSFRDLTCLFICLAGNATQYLFVNGMLQEFQ